MSGAKSIVTQSPAMNPHASINPSRLPSARSWLSAWPAACGPHHTDLTEAVSEHGRRQVPVKQMLCHVGASP